MHESELNTNYYIYLKTNELKNNSCISNLFIYNYANTYICSLFKHSV